MPTSQTTPTVTTYRPAVGVPTRKTSEYELDQFNIQLRSSPLYQDFMRQRGLPTNGRVKLSRRQQEDLEKAMARAGFRVPSGMHIDQGGNLNQKNRLGRNIAITAAIAGGTIATLGAAGVIGGAGAAAGGAGGAGAGAGAGAAAGGAATGAAAGGTAAATGATAAGWGGGAFGASMPVFVGAAAPAAATGLSTVAAPVLMPALASVPTAAGYAALASGPAAGAITGGGNTVMNSVAGGGMGASDWLDFIGKGVNVGAGIYGANQQTASNNYAADLLARGAAEQLAFEKDKEKRRQEEWNTAEEARKRNAAIDEENRLEDLRQLEQKDAQAEPRRVAKENAYRAYMKHYWGIDVAPTVARTPRDIQAAGTASKQVVDTPVNTTMPVSQPAPYTSPTFSSGALAPTATTNRTQQVTGPTSLAGQSIPYYTEDSQMALRRPYNPNEEMV